MENPTKPDSGIYAVEITRPGAQKGIYIGQARSIRQRFAQHINALRAGRHDNLRLQRSFVKYGESAFSVRTLLICAPEREILTIYEQVIVDFYAMEHGRRLYNVMIKCVASHLGVKRRPETIARISASQKGRKKTPEQVRAMSESRKGFRHSAASRAKMSDAQKALPRHPNFLKAIHDPAVQERRIRALRVSLCGKSKVHSEETKRKIAQTLSGRQQSEELIEKRIAPLRGRKQTPEEIAKRVASRLYNAEERRIRGDN